MAVPKKDTGDTQSRTPETDYIVRTQQLQMHYENGQTHALNGVTIAIREREFVAISGPSGSGKSSLLNLLGLLEAPTGGNIYFRDISYASITDESWFRRTHVGFIFQSFFLIGTLTVLENVLVPTIGQPGARKQHHAAAMALLSTLGIADKAGRYPEQLSGGERQRVAIARSLIHSPALLLADEPTGSLDSENSTAVMNLLDTIRSQRKITIVMVTHDANISSRADRVIAMRDGLVSGAEVAIP